MIIKKILIFLFLIFYTVIFAQSLKKISFMTENYPPYNYQQDFVLKGISVDLIIATMKKFNPDFSKNKIKLLPWARGYKIVQEEKNSCLFSTTRTKARERLFKWVGPISPALIVLIAKKERNIKISSIDNLKKYRIGTIINDVGEQLLIAKGLSLKTFDRVSGVGSILSSIKKLNSNRIDLFAYDSNVFKWEIKQINLNPADYEIVYVLKKGWYYYAFNKNTPDETIYQIQKNLDKLKKDGTYQKILDKYLK